MILKRLLVVIAAAAILFLQVQSCMSDPMSNQQDMQCCKSMPCTPMNKTQGCCKNMVSPSTPNMLLAQQHSLQARPAVIVDYLQTVDLAHWTTSSSFEPIRTQQHSPPELYTLHASLLI
jgi:hypothetical protein